MPDLEAAVLSVANVMTLAAFNNIVSSALTGFVANLIALETQFFVAIERVVSVLAAKDAVKLG